MTAPPPPENQVPDCGTTKVVLLAGGLGTRLGERTDVLPKPMIEIGGRPILWHIMKLYGHAGFNDFIIACGYRGEVIRRFFLEYRDAGSDLLLDYPGDTVTCLRRNTEPWRVALIDTGNETMTGGRLGRLREHLVVGQVSDLSSSAPGGGGGTSGGGAGTFLMTYGDGVADVDIRALLDFHREHGRAATLTTVRPPGRFGRLMLDGPKVMRFSEKTESPDEWINGGYLALDPSVLDRIAGDETSFEFDVLPGLAEEGELMAFRHDGFWQPMDTLRDVRNLNAMWNAGQAPWKLWE